MQLRASLVWVAEVTPLVCVSLQVSCPPGGWWQLPSSGCCGGYLEPSLPPCWGRVGKPRGCRRPAEPLPHSSPAGSQSSPVALPDCRRAAINSMLFVPSACALLFNSYHVRNNHHSSSSEPQIFSFGEESAAGILTCCVVLELCPGSLWKWRASFWPL